ncbi:hypothetical protein [Pseudomarimonas arenosa]|uniref:Uncharacterized protein n=1 Tax=Pseudomarimonas arenosa TaxID=2774145 RepID=A0AAW3ZU49_9GAMM|nr:hypothetical protein [Pseudomarimonas arenosa]MBD8528280.1 hypothetical protein [Pseudomarimonas arenosa]
MHSTPNLDQQLVRILQNGPQELVWEMVESVVHQGTRLAGAASVASAIVDAIRLEPVRVVLLARPLMQLCQGDPWAKFPVLLSDEHLAWSECESESGACQAVARAAANLCGELLQDGDWRVRHASRCVAFWERPHLACTANKRQAHQRIEELGIALSWLFSGAHKNVCAPVACCDSLMSGLTSSSVISKAETELAVLSAIELGSNNDLIWFDGDLLPALLFAAKVLRDDLIGTLSAIIESVQSNPFQLQSVLANTLRLVRSMDWSDHERKYFGSLQTSLGTEGWTYPELVTLRQLARVSCSD